MLITTRNKGGAGSRPVSKAPVSRRVAAAKEVAPQQEVIDSTITRHGNVATIGAQSGSFVTITITNASSADQEYIIGDGDLAIAAALGKTGVLQEPTAVAGSTPQAFKNLTRSGIAISGIHYQVTSNAAQFGNQLRMVTGNHDGSFGGVPLNILGTSRPDFQNDKLLVFQFENNVVLDTRNALTLVVNAGETVTLNCFVAAYGF